MIAVPDRLLRRIGWTFCALSILSAPVTVVLMAIGGVLDNFVANYGATNALSGLGYGAVGLVLVKAQPRNWLVWLFVLAGFCTAIPGPINGLAEILADLQGVDAQVLNVAGWPPGSAALLGYGYSLWVFGAFGVPTLGLLLAPDGRLLSRRWLPIAVLSVMSILSLFVAFASFWPITTDQPRDDSLADGVISVGFPVLLLLVLASLASLLLRYRRSDSALQRRLRWVLLGSAFSVLGGLASWSHPAFTLLIALLPLCYGMAIWRDQLFDVDVVISRTLVYGSILSVITGIYVAVVFGGGSLIGAADDSSILHIAAIALIAIAVHPARMRFERLANRIVFGRRATPYEVLSEFTQRVAATDEQLLHGVARLVADGTVATAASLWTLHDGMLRSISVWPADRAPAPTASLWSADGSQLLAPGSDETYTIRHEGKVVGLLGLTLPAGESLPPGDRALLEELTAGIGLALWNRELTNKLRLSIDELRASRRRLVAVQDKTRHRLERDLHDGAQQRLVAGKVRLSIARQMAEKAGAVQTAASLARLCGQADEVIESLRDFARGVYPPLLEAEGLGAALSALSGRLEIPIEMSCMVTDRPSREVEATVYFAIIELLSASGSPSGPVPVSPSVPVSQSVPVPKSVSVSVVQNPGRLSFAVAGGVVGPPPHHIEDRVEAMGGSLWFDERSTQVKGWLPIANADSPSNQPAMVSV